MPKSTSDFQYYYYEPNLAAAIVFVVLFALETGLHLFQLIRSRTWFMIPFLIGAICKAPTRMLIVHPS
jgi:hypothetical protein